MFTPVIYFILKILPQSIIISCFELLSVIVRKIYIDRRNVAIILFIELYMLQFFKIEDNGFRGNFQVFKYLVKK
jgi:hypothetical protein